MTEHAGRWGLVLLVTLGAAGCRSGEAAEEGPTIQTAQVTRGGLSVQVEATGTVEPVRSVEVKSKASGEILRLHVDVGDEVEQGTFLVEVDPRDVRNAFDQARADLQVARERVEIASAQLERSRRLLDAGVITDQENESARLEYANAQAALVKADTNHGLAELRLSDVTIRAPMAGTIIQKSVEEGQVIQSASQNVSGGTTLFVMANLERMQVRTLVDETDMGEVGAGLGATVRVEAYPARTFRGTVQKVEPQAVVEQNVTMFPVIVALDNREGFLKPGMNAEVNVLVDRADDVLLVPNSAIVQPADVGPAALALGLDAEALDLRSFMRVGREPDGGGEPGGAGAPARGAGAPAADGEGAGAPRNGPAGAGAARAGNGPGTGAAGEEAAARIRELRERVERGQLDRDSMRVLPRGYRSEGASGAGGFAGGGPASEARPTRPAAVFVMGSSGVPEPRLVRVGLNDWDNTEVVSGLDEGDVLAVVGAAQLQARQQEFLNNIRSRSGGSPFGGRGR